MKQSWPSERDGEACTGVRWRRAPSQGAVGGAFEIGVCVAAVAARGSRVDGIVEQRLCFLLEASIPLVEHKNCGVGCRCELEQLWFVTGQVKVAPPDLAVVQTDVGVEDADVTWMPSLVAALGERHH